MRRFQDADDFGFLEQGVGLPQGVVEPNGIDTDDVHAEL
jgi:hypothetical protein